MPAARRQKRASSFISFVVGRAPWPAFGSPAELFSSTVAPLGGASARIQHGAPHCPSPEPRASRSRFCLRGSAMPTWQPPRITGTPVGGPPYSDSANMGIHGDEELVWGGVHA